MLNKFLKQGELVMFISAIILSFMALSVKYASNLVSTPEIMFYRCIVSVFVILIFAGTGKANIKPVSKKLIIIRGLLGAVALTCYFHAISLATLSNAILLTYTYPIFGSIFSALSIKEYLTRDKIFFIALAMIGLFTIFTFDISSIGLGEILALTAGIVGGIAITVIRELRKTDSSWIIVLSFVTAGTVTGFALMGFRIIIPTLTLLILLIATGLFGTVGQLLMTYAYKHCSTALGGVISLSTVVITIILSYFIFGEQLTPAMVFGGLLILISAAALSFINNKKTNLTASR